MCFVFSLGPATLWLVLGFFVIYTAYKTKGRIKKFGKLLSIWLFTIALVIAMVGAYLSVARRCPIDTIIQFM